MRKEAGFEVTDRIDVRYKAEGRAEKVLADGGFKSDVLAESVCAGEPAEGAYTREQNINGEKVTLSILKK